MKALRSMTASLLRALFVGCGEVTNVLSGGRLRRIEAAAKDTREIAEENRKLLRALHDRLQDETLSAHLLEGMTERDAVDRAEP